MSVKAINWAFEQQGLTPTQKVVLLAMADDADSDGLCFPSWARLERRAEVSRSTVARAIKELAKKELVRRSNRYGESGRQTSSLYELALDVLRPPETIEGCQIDTGEGVTHDTGEGVTGDTPITLNHQKEPPEGKDPLPSPDKSFDYWWSLVWRRDGKGAARRAFKRAAETAGLLKLYDSTEKQCRYYEQQKTERRFQVMPATWLNQERWDDETLAQLDEVEGLDEALELTADID